MDLEFPSRILHCGERIDLFHLSMVLNLWLYVSTFVSSYIIVKLTNGTTLKRIILFKISVKDTSL